VAKIAKSIVTLQSRNNATLPIAAGKSIRGAGISKDIAPQAVEPRPAAKPLQPSMVSPFGIKPNNVTIYPNDAVVVDVFNALNLYLETNFRVNSYTKDDLDITLDVEADLKQFNYITGKYNVQYKFHRNYLGSGDGHRIGIQEISSDGLEVRVVPTLSSTISNADFLDFFAKGFFEITKAQVLPSLFLHRQTENGIESYRIFDYVQDKFTVSQNPFSIILKLAAPIPSSVTLGERV